MIIVLNIIIALVLVLSTAIITLKGVLWEEERLEMRLTYFEFIKYKIKSIYENTNTKESR